MESTPNADRNEHGPAEQAGHAAGSPPAAGQPAAPAGNLITFDDFAKVQLRVAKVVEAMEHPKADKLLVLKVDLGSEQRQIVAGIRGYYQPAELVGKSIIVAANLQPRMMRGFESQGMLLAASTESRDQVILLTVDKDIAPGSKVS